MEIEYSITEIERIKREVEILSKNHHIEILKIIKNTPTIKINENKSGVYINLTFLPRETLNSIQNYLNYINNQEQMLDIAEKEKIFFKNQLEDDKKEDKDNLLSMYSYIS
jgi:hypothetical protein